MVRHLVGALPHDTTGASTDIGRHDQALSSAAHSRGEEMRDAELMKEYAFALECVFAEVFDVAMRRQSESLL